MSICPQRCVCKLSHSPGQPPLNQTVKAAPRLALPSDSLTEGLHSGLDRKDGWHGCARWLKSATFHLAWRLPPLRGCWDRSSDWTPICLLLKLSAGMAQRLLFSSTSSDFLNHTLTPSHPHLNILTSSIRLTEQGRCARQDDSSGAWRVSFYFSWLVMAMQQLPVSLQWTEPASVFIFSWTWMGLLVLVSYFLCPWLNRFTGELHLSCSRSFIWVHIKYFWVLECLTQFITIAKALEQLSLISQQSIKNHWLTVKFHKQKCEYFHSPPLD